MHVSERLAEAFGPTNLSGKLEKSSNGDYVVPFTKYRESDLLRIFSVLKGVSRQRNDDEITWTAKPYRSDEERFYLPVLSKTEAEYQISRRVEIPLTLGDKITVNISGLKSTFTGGRKVWHVTVESPEITSLRKSLSIPTHHETLRRLFFAVKDPQETIARYITKSCFQEKVLRKLEDLPSEEFSPQDLHAAVEKEWFDVAGAIQGKGVVPFLKTAHLWSQNKVLMAAYECRQEVLQTHYDLRPEPVDISALLSTCQEEQIVSELQQLPTSLLTSKHIHKAAELGLYSVVDYMHKQCVVCYRTTYDLVMDKDPILAKSMRIDFEYVQSKLALKWNRQSVKADAESIITHLASEEEALEELCKLPVSTLSPGLMELAQTRGWEAVQVYLRLQGGALNRSQPIPIKGLPTPERRTSLARSTDGADICGSPSRSGLLSSSWGAFRPTPSSPSKSATTTPKRSLYSTSVPSGSFFDHFMAKGSRSSRRSSDSDE